MWWNTHTREAANLDDANIVHYGKQNTPTTHGELEKCSQFAETLMPEHGGIGQYKNFVHIDVRHEKARWHGA